MIYIEVTIKFSPFDAQIADITIANLAEIGFESFSETEDGILAYIPKNSFNPCEVEIICSNLSGKDISVNFFSNQIEDQNWNELWESNFEPITVEKLCRIRAPFHQSENGYNLEIIIEPKMSFGTGHHQTTWLMIRELFNENFRGKKVLDMGCGTGILSIVAEKLGAKSVHAIDIDSWAVNNTVENMAINNCSLISVDEGDISKIQGNNYDVILANINLNVLQQDVKQYFNALPQSGTLLVSGILLSDVEAFSSKAQSIGFSFINMKSKDDWAMIKFIKE